ncbi:MAG: calcium/sodium antiporter [Candidatus Bathyarchaeota archaeon]
MLQLLLESVLLGVGLIMLMKGADWLTDGAVKAARRFGISEFIIGLTIIAIGTSLPELSVSTAASLAGEGDVAVANVVGSSIFNIAVILGIGLIIVSVSTKNSFFHSGLIMVGFSLSLLLVLADLQISRLEGLLLLAAFIAYIVYLMRSKHFKVEAPATQASGKAWRSILLLGVGLVLIIAGAELVLSSAIHIAEALNISRWVISAVIIAIGTSLPEIVVMVVSALRRSLGISVGTLIGSNIVNIGVVLGVASLVRPMTISTPLVWLDLVVLALIAAVLVFFTRTGWRLSRWEGLILLLLYLVYIGVVQK